MLPILAWSLALPLPNVTVRYGDSCSNVPAKQDCGFLGIDETGCQQKGCCWQESPGEPWCFYKAQADNNCFVVPLESNKVPFDDSELEQMRTFFLNNVGVQGTGAVVAAPDHNTPGGSYYYHWERDGALTMASVQDVLPTNRTRLEKYTEWVLARQHEQDPNGIDVRTEPKYEIPSGRPYNGGWCRPQNDGPGLRASALIKFAMELLGTGRTEDADYVRTNLWTGNPDDDKKGGAIRYDLDYILTGYNSESCDLWEEVRSQDFFWNRVTMRGALLTGATFATKMGDQKASTAYGGLANEMSRALVGHWQGPAEGASDGGFVYEETNRKIDGAVMVGLNHGFDSGLASVFAGPASEKIASTVEVYNKAFCAEYPINRADTAEAVPGVLYGRYPGDHYAGGNPWVLTTAALAQLLYRASSDASAKTVDNFALQAWIRALKLSQGTSAKALPKFLALAADGVLLRLRKHVEPDGFHLNEQIDKTAGRQMSAQDLTWSYAEVLNAMLWRSAAYAAM